MVTEFQKNTFLELVTLDGVHFSIYGSFSEGNQKRKEIHLNEMQKR